MESSTMPKITMRVGIALGAIAVLLIAMGPQILGNFGTTTVVHGAPVAMTLTTTYLLLTLTSLPFSAALIAASLVMRHAESLAPRKASRPIL